MTEAPTDLELILQLSAEMREHRTTMLGEYNQLRKRLSTLEHRVGLIHPHEVERTLNGIQADARALHDRVQLTILRQMVLSELLRATRGLLDVRRLQIVDACIAIIDWWHARRDWTIGRWLQFCGHEYEAEMAPPPDAGICRGCGCTDEHACEDGCAWADDAHTLCSRCAEAAEHAS